MADEQIKVSVKLDGVDQATSQLKTLSSQLNNIQSQGDPFTKHSESTKGFSKNIAGLKDSMGLLPAGIQNVIGSVQAFSKALLATPVGWLMLAVTALVGALTLLGKAFIGTDSGGLKFAILMKQISTVIDVVINRVAQLAQGLVKFFSGDFSAGINDMSRAFSGLGTEIGNAATAARDYAIAMDEIEDRQTRFISQEAEMEAAISKQLYVAADQTKSVKERMAALQEAQKLERAIADEKLKAAQDTFNAEVNLAAKGNAEKKRMMQELITVNEATFNELMKKPLYANLYNSKEFQDNIKKLEEGYAAVQKASAAGDDATKKAASRTSAFQNQLAAEAKQREKDKWDFMVKYGLKSMAEQRDNEIKEVKKTAEYRALTVEQQEAVIFNIKKSWDEKWEAYKKEQDKNEITRMKTRGEIEVEEAKNTKNELEKVDNTYWEKRIEDDEEKEQKRLEDSATLNQTILEGALTVTQSISDAVFGAISESIQATYEQTMTKIGEYYTEENKKNEDLFKRRLITESQYNKNREKLAAEQATKEKAAKRDAAKKAKEFAIMQAIINTALAVVAALTSPVNNAVPGLAIAMALINGALGAIQIAAIAAQPLPEFKKGGEVKKYAMGGMLSGPSHDQGGIPLYAEGGEFIINKSVSQRPGMNNFLTDVNQGKVNPNNQTTATINVDDLRSIVQQVSSIPVNVVETDISSTQKRVSVIESNSSW